MKESEAAVEEATDRVNVRSEELEQREAMLVYDVGRKVVDRIGVLSVRLRRNLNRRERRSVRRRTLLSSSA